VVIAIFILFLIKDLIGFKKDSVKYSAAIETARYLLEFCVVIASGFLSWEFFDVIYAIVAILSTLLAGLVLVFWRHFEIAKMANLKMKEIMTSKVRMWDFLTIGLLFCAGYFDTLIAALWGN
jgi:hypothetical protein